MKPSSAKLTCVWMTLAVCSAATAQDECDTAVPLGLGTTPFDTTAATTSAEPWPCGTGGSDIWFAFTAPSTALYGFSTCANASFDTTIEILTGTCGALTSLACNDDACALQSGASAAASAGDVLYVRVGGFGGATGIGDLEVVEVLPRSPSCLSTLYASNNFGNVGGAVYFTLTAAQDINIDSLRTNFGQPLGTPVGMEIWQAPAGTTPGGAGWNLVGVDDGSAFCLGGGNPTPIQLAAQVPITAGAHAIALVAIGSEHRYTNGDGTNQSYTDGVVTLDLGMATNVPFAAPVFDPRVWNGTICYTPAVTGLPDFSIAALSACDLGQEYLLSIDVGHIPDYGNIPASLPVIARIDVTGPSTTPPPDDQDLTYLAPVGNLGTCGGNPPCTGTCTDWAVRIVKGNQMSLQNVKAICVPTAANPVCQCTPGNVKVQKPKPKFDGPGPYTITVTIDPDGLIAESNEGNNTMTITLDPSSPPCDDLGVPDTACTPLPHSLGGTVTLELSGSGDAGDLVVGTASNGVPGQFGYFLSGPNPGLYLIPPGSSGVICIASPQFRYSSVPDLQVFQFDPGGVSRTVIGGGSSLLPTDGSYAPVPPVMAGTSRAFQAWFRDVSPFESNFSESKIVMFN